MSALLDSDSFQQLDTLKRGSEGKLMITGRGDTEEAGRVRVKLIADAAEILLWFYSFNAAN